MERHRRRDGRKSEGKHPKKIIYTDTTARKPETPPGKKKKNKNAASPATPDSQQQIDISINAARVAEPQPTQSIEIFCRQLEIELICFAFQKL